MKLETFLVGSVVLTVIATVMILAWGIISNRGPIR